MKKNISPKALSVKNKWFMFRKFFYFWIDYFAILSYKDRNK